jgi:hypothetical protein
MAFCRYDISNKGKSLAPLFEISNLQRIPKVVIYAEVFLLFFSHSSHLKNFADNNSNSYHFVFEGVTKFVRTSSPVLHPIRLRSWLEIGSILGSNDEIQIRVYVLQLNLCLNLC